MFVHDQSSTFNQYDSLLNDIANGSSANPPVTVDNNRLK